MQSNFYSVWYLTFTANTPFTILGTFSTPYSLPQILIHFLNKISSNKSHHYFTFLHTFLLLLCFIKEYLNKWQVILGIEKFFIPNSPPHLCLDPPRQSPHSSEVCPLSWANLPRLSLPPSGQSGCSGWSAAAGEVLFCGHRDWMTGKPQSPLWPTRVPNRDGIPAYDGPPSRSAWLESRAPRCQGLPFSWERERLVHCGGLKLCEIDSWLLLNPMFTKDMVAL